MANKQNVAHKMSAGLLPPGRSAGGIGSGLVKRLPSPGYKPQPVLGPGPTIPNLTKTIPRTGGLPPPPSDRMFPVEPKITLPSYDLRKVPSYKKGGTVKETGLALVHKGEKVIPNKKKSIAHKMKPKVKKHHDYEGLPDR